MKLHSIAAAMVLSLFLSSVVVADPHEKGPCFDEIKKLCPDMKMGEGMGKCMHEKKSQLTPECQAKMAEKKDHMKERMHAWGKACKDDVKKHCKDVQKGEGRIVDCLKAHLDGLAPACKEKMDKL